MKLTKIFGTEDSGYRCGTPEKSCCPTFFQLENGDYVVQGYLDTGVDEGFETPNGEGVVRLPKEFLEAFLAANKRS